MPSCIRAAQMWYSLRVAPFMGALGRRGLMWYRTTHLVFTCLCGCLSSPDRASTSLNVTAVHQKGKQSGRSKPLLDMQWIVGERGSSLWNCPSCKFTADLQLSAGQFTITFNTLTPTVSWVSIRQCLLSQTSSKRLPLLSVTTPDRLGFVFHYSSGFLRPDRIVLCCLFYKINL